MKTIINYRLNPSALINKKKEEKENMYSRMKMRLKLVSSDGHHQQRIVRLKIIKKVKCSHKTHLTVSKKKKFK